MVVLVVVVVVVVVVVGRSNVWYHFKTEIERYSCCVLRFDQTD